MSTNQEIHASKIYYDATNYSQLTSHRNAHVQSLHQPIRSHRKKKITFEQLSKHYWAYTAEGDPNSGVIIGDGKSGRQGSLPINHGGVVVEIWHPGMGHTRGDTIAWMESEGVLFSGDLVEYEAGVYNGDAQLQEWLTTLEALRKLEATYIVPGRGETMKGKANMHKALDYTKRWVETLYRCGQEAVAQKLNLKDSMALTRKSMDSIFGHVFIYEHCLPFDVNRAYDAASGIKNPRIWTAARDKEMWSALQA